MSEVKAQPMEITVKVALKGVVVELTITEAQQLRTLLDSLLCNARNSPQPQIVPVTPSPHPAPIPVPSPFPSPFPSSFTPVQKTTTTDRVAINDINSALRVGILDVESARLLGGDA